MSDAKLTEPQAWLSVAMMFENYTDMDQMVGYGLCHTIEEMEHLELIDEQTHANMAVRIADYMEEDLGIDSCEHIWPVGREHAQDRAQLARKFAQDSLGE